MTDSKPAPLFESTQNESSDRVSKLFSGPSENVSELLVPPIIDNEDIDKEKNESSIDLSKIEDYFKDHDKEIILILEADPNSPYKGMKVWDVLSCLGLKWGDMDTFHWENKNNLGDDYYFDVWTLDNPGYFLPEWLNNDDYYLGTLVFGFSIPRTYKPTEIFNSMVKAMEYAQKRLGGKIFDRNGNPADYSNSLKNISEVETELAKLNIKSGTGSALASF